MKKIIEGLVKSHGNNLDTRIAFIEASSIKTDKSLRTACKQNYCGHYGKNWGCPPGVGTYESLRNSLKNYSDAVVIQTIHKLEDSFDYEGMMAAQEKHVCLFREVREDLRKSLSSNDPTVMLGLSAGACTVCENCTYPEGKPCRFPEKANASIESYCINVNSLLNSCSLEYNNGENTVFYVSLFLK